jgi:hypothetical protein
MNLCVCDSEECERGVVGAGVNATMMFSTLQVVGFAKTVRPVIWLWQPPVNLCVCNNEECE